MATDFLFSSVFAQIAALLMLAAAVGFIGNLLRQPLIVSFIVVGILAGPSVLNLVHAEQEIDLLAELGIALLLFLVGLKLDMNLIRSLGTVSLTTGLGQVAFTSAFGFLIGLALGFSSLESLYIAVALTFSSTIIIVKLLSDKREIDSLHGQVALGFLIVQDLVVVLAMIVLSAIGIGSTDDASLANVATVLGAGLALVAFVVVFANYIADPLVERMAQAPELLISFSIALAALFAAAGDFAGFGKELGGLMAGVALASTRFREAIASRLAPLRDFLLLFFFVALGSRLQIDQLGSNLFGALIFSLFVLVGNPLIVLAIMGVMGFRKRTGFLAGLTVAQISEFSLIFIAMGVTIGHLQEDSLGLVTLVGMITIALSTYMITYSHHIYAMCEPFLGVFERRNPDREPEGDPIVGKYDTVIFGLGRFGTAIGLRLKERGLRVLGIDFNPAAVRRWRKLGLNAEFGDATDPEFVAGLDLSGIRWTVSTAPDQSVGVAGADSNLALLHGLKAAGFAGKIAVTLRHEMDPKVLMSAGADLVLEPFQDAADQAVDLLTGDRKPTRLEIEPVAGEFPDG
ncbi:MAG: cation:proton antiporter [Rhizobiaceae bacterium]